MKTKYVIAFLVFCTFISCSSSKTNATAEQIAQLDELMATKSFRIESQWALPQATRSMIALQNSGILAPGDSASRISLIGNPNFLELNGDSINSYLPYYGEVQMVSNRNGSGSIELKNTIEDYELSKADNNSYTLKFQARSKNESFNVMIQLFPNLNTEISLNGTKRFPIRYTGNVSSISDK